MSPFRFLAIAAVFPLAVSAAELNKQDQDYLRERAQALMADVQAGQMASKKASTELVRAFAYRMVNDHQRALEGVRTLSSARNVELPADITDREARQMKKLTGLSGLEFDEEYIERAIRAHKAGTKADRKRMYATKDRELRALASTSHDVETAHLAQANRALGNVPAK